MDSFIDVRCLANLLKQPEEDSDSENEADKGLKSFNPCNIGPKKNDVAVKKTELKTIRKDTKDIWNAEEITEGAEYANDSDPRAQPEYEMLYKQAVTTEDMFLQLNNKTPSSASCENLLVKIKLPGCKLSDIMLDVKQQYLDCRTANYKLGLFLPHKVDASATKAAWDVDLHILTVTLLLNREYDMLNF